MIKKKTLKKTAAPIRDAPRPEFYQSVAEVLHNARANAYRAVNFAMVEAYWQIGRMIIEEEQQGKERAGYGEALIRNLSVRLMLDFGKGFSVSNLWAFKQFYLSFPILRTVCGESSGASVTSYSEIRGTLCPELSWSHYRLLIRVEKPEARAWYMKEAAEQNWPVRALQRQITPYITNAC